MENLYSRLAPFLLAIIELFLMGGAAVLIMRSPRRTHAGGATQPSQFRSLERAFGRLARRKTASILVIGLGVATLRVALIPVLGVPQPQWNDEFSYLLAADTFAHGKVTNPTHPMWIHFESFHIIEHPTYMSMYPPAQGLVLAAGQILGHPWIGQVVVTALMCAVLCWMLQGWLPPKWALLGAVLAALRLGILSYWMNTYWCASVAALGGAFVLGAWPRLRRRPSVSSGLFLGLGLVILANSRPYEGLVFSVPIACAMLLWLVGRMRQAQNGQPIHGILTRAMFPIFLVLSFGGVATGWYYQRVTGSPFEMTYQVNRGQYATAPYFIWQAPRPEPAYHHAVMRDYYRSELEEFETNRTVKGYILRAADKIQSWWQFYLGPLLTIPLLGLPGVIRQRKMALPLLVCGAMIVGFSVQTWTLPHYFSPATGALYILLVQGLRQIRQWRGRRASIGAAVVRAIPLLACAMILLRVTATATHTHIEPDWPRGNLDRAAILTTLERRPGKDLVLVHYGPHHNLHHEWVWNEASIDDAKVVWAWDMSAKENEELLQYFKDRRAWRIDGDDSPPQLKPYSAESPRD